MTSHAKLNLYLLVLNSNFAIVIIFLLISTLAYIVWQAREHEMTRRDWLVQIPLGVAVALAFYIENFGQLGVRVTVWLWRLAGAKEALDYAQQVTIGVFSGIGLIGLLLLIRATSKPRFGEKMWLSALAFVAINTVVTVYLFLPA
jgi:hypothetical protein